MKKITNGAISPFAFTFYIFSLYFSLFLSSRWLTRFFSSTLTFLLTPSTNVPFQIYFLPFLSFYFCFLIIFYSFWIMIHNLSLSLLTLAFSLQTSFEMDLLHGLDSHNSTLPLKLISKLPLRSNKCHCLITALPLKTNIYIVEKQHLT